MFRLAIAAVIALLTGCPQLAYAQAHWALGTGEKLEVIRDFHCFDEGKGRREASKVLRFSGEVQHAEVFLSGFNTWYSQGADQHQAGYRVDTWITRIGDSPCVDCPGMDLHLVIVHIEYTMQDANPTSGSDSTKGCVGFTAIAGTR